MVEPICDLDLPPIISLNKVKRVLFSLLQMNMCGGTTYSALTCSVRNDLHGLDMETMAWFPVKTTGEQPPPRANHASAVDDHRLYIFGGWDGTKRLNDLYEA